MTVPMIDLGEQHAGIAEEVTAAMGAVMDRGQFVLGPEVAAFEGEAASYLGVDHAVSCASGTDALHLALRALGIGPGDEVITTAFSFFAAIEAIRYLGARPVFVDIDPRTYTLNPTQVEAALTPSTRALLPVHLFGQAAAMEPLLEIAARHGLVVVEDCAQSFGARRNHRATGTFGHAGCFSFFPTKNLGAYGDGGMVTTHSAALAQTLRRLRNHGGSERHRHECIGYNSRLDELQAVVLRAKLKRIDQYNTARRQLAHYYSHALADLPAVTAPWVDPEGEPVFNLYTLQVPERDRLYRALQDQGIGCAIHYPMPLYRQPALAGNYPDVHLPVTEAVTSRCLSLPLYPEMSQAQADQVIEALCHGLSYSETQQLRSPCSSRSGAQPGKEAGAR